MKGFGDYTTVNGPLQGIYDVETGEYQQYKHQALTRTYVQKYSGTPLGSRFNSDTGDYSVRLVPSANPTANRLYLHEAMYYTDGFDVSCVTLQGKPV